MKEIIVNALKLCLITLVAGVLLGVVYEVTKEPRAAQEEKAKNKAYAKVFEDAVSFESYDCDEDALKSYLAKNGIKDSKAFVNEIVQAVDKSGNALGYVITVTDKEGYGGNVVFTLGITNDGVMNGISFLTLEETAGVGMKANDDKFKSQFAGMKAEEIEYTKTGKSADNQIDAISGATVTTNAVTNGVNCGVYAYQFLTEGGSKNE